MSAVQKFDSHDSEAPQLFDPESLGSSFEELAIDVVQGENTEFISRWFRAGRADADLVIWIDGAKRIVKQQLCLYGQVVEWNPITGTRTGAIIEQEVAPDEASGQSGGQSAGKLNGQSGENTKSEPFETIRFDSRAQVAAVNSAIRVLSSVPQLTENERKHLIFHLRESTKLHKKARERALQTWSLEANEIISNSRPSVWHRMRKWFLGC